MTREELAAIIDKWAFDVTHTGKPWDERRNEALAKADTILSRLSQESVDAEVVKVIIEELEMIGDYICSDQNHDIQLMLAITKCRHDLLSATRPTAGEDVGRAVPPHGSGP